MTAALTNYMDDNHIHNIRYEALMRDSNEMKQLLYGLGLNPWKLYVLSSGLTGRCRVNCTKSTSDDLRKVILNYDEVETWIRVYYPCLLPQFYESRSGVVQPRAEDICGDQFISRIRSEIDIFLNGTVPWFTLT